MEKHKRSCYETMENHGEDTSCRTPLELPLGKENLWTAALQEFLVLAIVVFDSIGK